MERALPSAVTTVRGDRPNGDDRDDRNGRESRDGRKPRTGVSPGDGVGGRYVVEEVLGSGGMGVVVAARHETLGHRVAIKLVSATTSADALVRFSREARIIASLESDHVVRVIDYGVHDGTPYMVMDLLAGRDLGRELQSRGALPVEEAVDYVIQACDGLAVAHAKGVVHRDVKLANLFAALRADGERTVKVLDFGVSKLSVEAPDDVQLTRTSTMIGSPLYMSPEQIRDPRAVDARADIWSLGIVLYKLLTNEPPFEGLSTNAVCAAIAADPPRPPTAHVPELPAALETVVLRCLEKRREHRYPSVSALARELGPFASSRGRVLAEALFLREPDDAAFESGVDDGVAVAEARSRGSRASRPARALAWAGVAALVTTVAAVATLGARRSTAPGAAAGITSAPVAASDPTASIAAAASAPLAADPATAPALASSPAAASPDLPAVVTLAPSVRPPRRGAPGAAGAAVVTPARRPAATPGTHFGGSALDDHH